MFKNLLKYTKFYPTKVSNADLSLRDTKKKKSELKFQFIVKTDVNKNAPKKAHFLFSIDK